MIDNQDEELEKIKREKIRDMLRNATLEKMVKSKVNKPIEVTDSTFREIIQANKLVVVDCWAAWCGPCRMVAPIIDELANDYSGKIVFGKLNVDQNKEVAMNYHVMSIPTLLIFKDGKLIDQIVGALPRHILEPKLTQYL